MSSVIPFSSCLQFFPASGFSNESVLHVRWPKYLSFSFSINPSNEHSGLISFRMDWLDLLALTRVLSNTTVQKHQFFGAQPSLWSTLTSIHDYWKTTALIIWIFVHKVMLLLFNTLSNFVIALLLRSKCLLISWSCHHLR